MWFGNDTPSCSPSVWVHGLLHLPASIEYYTTLDLSQKAEKRFHPGVLLLLQGVVPGRRVTEHGVAQASELLVTQGLSSSSCLRDAWQRNGEETQPCPCIPNECPLSQVWVVCMWCIIHLTGKSHFLLSHFIRVPLTLDIESHATRICYLRQIV